MFYSLPANSTRREEWLMGRIAAKEALREWLKDVHNHDLASADIELLADADGRPRASCARLPDLALPTVSISHSRRWAAASLSMPGAPCGLDYQRLDHVDPDLLVAGALTDLERALL